MKLVNVICIIGPPPPGCPFVPKVSLFPTLDPLQITMPKRQIRAHAIEIEAPQKDRSRNK